MIRAGVAFDDEEVVVLVLHIAGVNAKAVQDGSVDERLNLVAPLRQHHKQRGQHEQPDHVKHERFAGKSVDDQHDRPDDEQHESHDAQQFVQLHAFLQERRE